MLITTLALLLSRQSGASETKGFYLSGRYYSRFFASMGKLKLRSEDANYRIATDFWNDGRDTPEELYHLDKHS